MQLHLSVSNSCLDDSLDDCNMTGANDAAIVTSRVPFKWEEAPGKPISANMPPSCLSYDHIALQLPPKLQFPGHRSPLFSQQSPYESPSRSPLYPSRVSPHHPKLKRLYTYMLKTASWSQPLHTLIHHQSQLWHRSPYASLSDAKHDKLSSNERFFFDKASPRVFQYSVSMDSSWKTQLPIHEEYKQHDAFIRSQRLSCLAMEEQEAESTTSSPWHPILFHEREGSESPCQPTTIKAPKKLDRDGEENDESSPLQLTKPIKGDDEEEDDDGLHDFFSTASSSLEKPSQRIDESIEPSYPSQSPWLLDFGPQEEDIHEAKEGSKLVVRLVTLVKLKKIISSKVSKLRGRRDGANQQANRTSMWSPTFATYLYNQQKKERQSSSASLEYIPSEEEEEEEEDSDELASSSSGASSHRFQINPDYHLPSSILRGHLHTIDDVLEGEGSCSFTVHQLRLDENPCFSREVEQPHKVRKRLSLREQLSEFDDETPLQSQPSTQSSPPQNLDSRRREPTSCKRACKVRRTVKILVATIKLIFIHSDKGKRKEQQRPFVKYSGCLKPTITTLTPFPSTHKVKTSTF